jgi:hypothetical protein
MEVVVCFRFCIACAISTAFFMMLGACLQVLVQSPQLLQVGPCGLGGSNSKSTTQAACSLPPSSALLSSFVSLGTSSDSSGGIGLCLSLIASSVPSRSFLAA